MVSGGIGDSHKKKEGLLIQDTIEYLIVQDKHHHSNSEERMVLFSHTLFRKDIEHHQCLYNYIINSIRGVNINIMKATDDDYMVKLQEEP